jgi:hypothetical protein
LLISRPFVVLKLQKKRGQGRGALLSEKARLNPALHVFMGCAGERWHYIQNMQASGRAMRQQKTKIHGGGAQCPENFREGVHGRKNMVQGQACGSLQHNKVTGEVFIMQKSRLSVDR